jgi:hypothetical protein
MRGSRSQITPRYPKGYPIHGEGAAGEFPRKIRRKFQRYHPVYGAVAAEDIVPETRGRTGGGGFEREIPEKSGGGYPFDGATREEEGLASRRVSSGNSGKPEFTQKPEESPEDPREMGTPVESGFIAYTDLPR